MSNGDGFFFFIIFISIFLSIVFIICWLFFDIANRLISYQKSAALLKELFRDGHRVTTSQLAKETGNKQVKQALWGMYSDDARKSRYRQTDAQGATDKILQQIEQAYQRGQKETANKILLDAKFFIAGSEKGCVDQWDFQLIIDQLLAELEKDN